MAKAMAVLPVPEKEMSTYWCKQSNKTNKQSLWQVYCGGKFIIWSFKRDEMKMVKFTGEI